MKKILTGLQPTGVITLGNYIGAIKQMVKYQENYDSYIFIADLHSITVPQDPYVLRGNIKSLVAIYLACGIDPNKNTIFIQSENEYHTNISWLLECNTYFGELSRMTQFKDKSKKSVNFSAGLFTYPVLMASDILAYDIDYVPVGIDQKQHVEIARDIANSFNVLYKNDILKLPEEYIQHEESIIGLDGRKMSKSYKNTIEIFATEDDTTKKIMKIPTDNLLPSDAKPDNSTLYKLMEMFKVPESYLQNYLRGGIGYGDAKKTLAKAVNTYLAPYREKFNILMADKSKIDEALKIGAIKAREEARKTLNKVKQTLGLID